MKTLFLVLFSFFFSFTHAQESSAKIPAQEGEIDLSAGGGLLNRAESIKHIEPQRSLNLVNQALELSEQNKNYPMSAQAHTLLGELAFASMNIVQGIEHFLQASIIYRDINDDRYDEAYKVIDELQPIVLHQKKSWSVAKVLITQGEIDYKNKHYADAIEQYSHALIYLSDPDKMIQKKLGEVYKKIAQSYKRLKDRGKTALFYKKTLDVFTAIQDKKNMARTLNTLAESERYLGNYFIALDYSTQGLEIHKQIDDPVGHAKALTGAGIIYRYIGRYEKSLEHIYEAYQYYQKVNNVSGLAKTSNQMGLIYTRLKEFEQARSFYQFTVELPRDKVARKTLASALREIAVIDLNAGAYESAKEMATQAQNIYQSLHSKEKLSITARILGNIYRAELNYPQAIAYYRESLSIATEIGSKIYQVKAQTPLAAMLINRNTDEAIRLLKKAVSLSTDINSNSQKLYAYRELRKAEKSLENYESSLGYAEQEILYTGIIQREKDNNQLAIAKAKLYSHKIEMELDFLKKKSQFDKLEITKKNHEIESAEQKRIIAELELTKNKYANVMLALLLLISMLLVIFLYRRFVASKKRNKELDYLATRDPLTNCYNRRVLFEHMDKDFATPELFNEYCIIMADIDHFKKVNDTYGHNEGDSVICGVADILRSCVRQSDIVVRYGGEEFCIVLHLAPLSQAMHIAEKMREKIETSHFNTISVTCSFGVSSIQFNAKVPEELINQADLALYRSKSRGRNQVMLWEEGFEKQNNSSGTVK